MTFIRPTSSRAVQGMIYSGHFLISDDRVGISMMDAALIIEQRSTMVINGLIKVLYGKTRIN
jgi:serine kinase of HPr protein (carbohydrate metabolism regulator)